VRPFRHVAVGVAVLLAAAGCAEATVDTSPPDESDVRNLDGWFEVLDSELADVPGAEAWIDVTEVHVAPVCGPADEFEGWQLTSTFPVDSGLEPPDDRWERADQLGGAERPHVWRHRDHPTLLLRAAADRSDVQVSAASYGADHDAWDHADGMPDTHPRVHPRPLDPGTGRPVASFCG
jgi:hypothetical protein